jgi:hypothetical protein
MYRKKHSKSIRFDSIHNVRHIHWASWDISPKDKRKVCINTKTNHLEGDGVINSTSLKFLIFIYIEHLFNKE